MGCCKDGTFLTDWAEERTLGGMAPISQLPLPYCLGGNRKKKCAMCKSGIKIVTKSRKKNCKYFGEHPKPKGAVLKVFARSKVTPGAKQTPKHASFRKRVRVREAPSVVLTASYFLCKVRGYGGQSCWPIWSNKKQNQESGKYFHAKSFAYEHKTERTEEQHTKRGERKRREEIDRNVTNTLPGSCLIIAPLMLQICKCLGCCDSKKPSCPVPVAYDTLEQALGKKPGPRSMFREEVSAFEHPVVTNDHWIDEDPDATRLLRRLRRLREGSQLYRRALARSTAFAMQPPVDAHGADKTEQWPLRPE